MAAAAQQAMVDLLRRLGDEAAAPRAGVLLVLATATLLLVVVLPLLFRHFTASTASPTDDALLSRLPSPPNKLPVIGHLHLMGAFPPISLAALAAKHGPDLMLLRLGTVPTVVASSPRAAEAILRTHDHIFASRAPSMVAEVLMYGQSDSCYSPYGDHFRKVRKVVTVHLLNSNKVQAYRPAREEVGLVVAKLKAAAAAGSVVDMSEVLNSFANDLICRAVSGKFFREEGRNEMFRELIDTNARLLGGFNLEDYFPRLARVGPLRKILCANAKKMRERWDKLLEEIIDEHAARAARRQDQDEEIIIDEHQEDFIDVLLSRQQEYGLTRDHIKALLIDMFEAGTDTSYSSLDVAMAELMRKPEVMAKLQAEVRKKVPQGQEMVTESDLGNMTYLKAVIKETLRLHPAAPLFVPHLSMEACEVDGYTIPSGTRVVVNGWAIGRLSSHWEKPDEFMPERFADDVDLKGKSDFRYLPFGSGRRMCPGIHSAAATLEIMLANLMFCFDWELPAGVKKEDIDMAEVFGLTVHRKDKLLLVPKIP